MTCSHPFVSAVAPPVVAEFSKVTSPSDFSVTEAWVKYDDRALYLAFGVTDDVAYGVDTSGWTPSDHPEAKWTNRSGWPWFGDEMEVLIDARPLLPTRGSGRGPRHHVTGNQSQWQLVGNTIKSLLGGYGTGGAMPGEPRTNPEPLTHTRA